MYNSIELSDVSSDKLDLQQFNEMLNVEVQNLNDGENSQLNLASLCIFLHARIEATCRLIKTYQRCTSACILTDEQITQIINNNGYVYGRLFDDKVNKYTESITFVKYYYIFSTTFTFKTDHEKLDHYLEKLVNLSKKIEDQFYKHATPHELLHVFKSMSVSKVGFFNKVCNTLMPNNDHHFKRILRQ